MIKLLIIQFNRKLQQKIQNDYRAACTAVQICFDVIEKKNVTKTGTEKENKIQRFQKYSHSQLKASEK